MPLKPTTGFIKLQVQDIDEIRYVADIFINERVIPKKPLPPKDPRIEVIRGKALVSVLFDNPPTLPRNAAPTAGVNIYRKIASRPDAEYRLLNDKGPLVPNEAEREQIRKKLSLTEQPGQPASTPERRPGRGEVEEAKPVEAAKPVSGAWGPAPGDIRRDAAQPDTEKSLVWLLDEGVSPGETYLYKIVSVTEAIKGADQERQESDPWVSPPVEVPSDVEYRLVSVREDVATIRVWKFDYKYDKWFEKTFQVAAGMKIGRPERVKADKADAESVEIDFSTGARLVAAIEEAPTIDVQVKWERKVVGGRVQVVQVPVLVDKKLSMIVVTARNGGLESQYRGKAQPPERVQKKLKSTIEKREVKAEPKAPGDIEPPAPGPGPGPGPGPDVRKPPRTGR
jgi:hypothetical protein